MIRTHFLEIAENYKIAYIKNHLVDNNSLTLTIFLHGYHSNKTATKSLELYDFCTKHQLPYLAFDYRFHGDSSGENGQGGKISEWLEDCTNIIGKMKQRNFILIGSSLGGWIMLLLALRFPQQIKGLIGIAPAANFTEKLIYQNLTSQEKIQLEKTGRINFVNKKTGAEFDVTHDFLIDAKKFLLLNKPININVPVSLLHGMQDVIVPYEFSIDIAKQITSNEVTISLIKDGDHRLSRTKDIEILFAELLKLYKNL